MTFSLPVFPLRQKSECLLSLEAYSQEQKKRICWCLAENITKQQHPASAPPENKVSDPCGHSPAARDPCWEHHGALPAVGVSSGDAPARWLAPGAVFCQVRSESAFGHCCICSFPPCLGKRWLHLHPLTRVEADFSKLPAPDAS